MDVVELGCGVCGLVCAEQLSRSPKVDSLILADSRPEGAEALAGRLKSDVISVKKVDGTNPKALKRLLKDADIVIATLPWRLNKPVLKTAAETGTNYVDFGMPIDSTGPEFDALSDMCARSGISALVGMGEEPGMSDVFAMHAASKLDVAHEAHIYDGDNASIEGVEFFSLWSPVDLLDETSVPAAVFKDGSIEFIPPLSARQIYKFPKPIGPLPVYKTNHDETYFMPRGIKTLKHASFNIGIDDGFAQASAMFRKWGLLSKEPVNVRGTLVVPQHLVASLLPNPSGFGDKVKGHTCFVVEVIGEKKGRKTKVKMWIMMSHHEAYRLQKTNAGAYFVGTGGAIATEMLIDGEVKEKGFVIPEQLSSSSFLARMKKRGIKVNEEIKSI